MARNDRDLRIVELVSNAVRSAGLSAVAAVLLFTAATGEGQALRLHTSSLASPTSTSYVVSFDGQGQPYPPTAGTFPVGFAASWQFPASGASAPYGLRFYPSLRFASVGAAAEEAVVLSSEARTVLQSGGFLDAADGYVAGSPRSIVVAATATREGRQLLVLDSSAKSAIALFEIGVEGGKPTIRSAIVKTGVSLPADTYGALGAGITFGSGATTGTVVFGDGSATYKVPYTTGATGSRFGAIDPIPSPPGTTFHYISATSAGADGQFWVVGVNGLNYEVRYLDALTKTWDAPVATIARAAGDVLIPAFDPYDPSRMLLVVSKAGGTPTYVLTGLTRGANKGALSPTATNTGLDFSTSPALQPVVLAPVSGGGRGYLVGRTAGEPSERLYAIDLTSGAMTSTPIVFGTARHQSLVLERPDQTLSIKADSTGAVSGGQNATFTVTRADSTGDFVVRYRTVDGTAVNGRDFSQGTGAMTIPSGSATGKISIAITNVDGCALSRTFEVELVNTDAAITAPAKLQQTIAPSTNCTFGVVAPTTSVTAGQPMTFTATRSGTYLNGAQALPWTAAPGNSATTAADFSPVSSNVTIASGAASATFSVNTTATSLACVPEKAVTVTVTPAAGASSSATGKIAPVVSGCTVEPVVTGPESTLPPESPYLPGDEISVTLREGTAGRYDLAKTTWTVTSLGGTTYEKLTPTGSTGAVLTLRFHSGTAEGAAGSLKVDYSVPALPGPSAPPTATGSLPLDRAANYPDLVRLDGPGQYSVTAPAKKRYSLLWGGGTRKTTWLDPKANNVTEKKTVRWSYWRGAAQTAIECERRVGEDCVFTLPVAGDVTKVQAEVATGTLTWATIAEIPVKGVAAASSTNFETVRYVPVALEFPGVSPTFFETELTLVNGSSGTAEAELKWGGLTQKEIVGAGRQAVINGLVECLRETNPAQSTAVSPLKVTFRGLANDAEKRLVGVVARTTTPAGAQSLYRRSGRAGLAYRGIPREDLLGGAADQTKSAWLIGLRGTSSAANISVDRSNLAVTKPDPGDPDGVVDVELYGNDGTLVKTLAAQIITGFTQWANLAGVAGGPEVAYARVVWKSGGPVTTYATPINNASGDGSWVFPVKQEDANATKTDALLAPVLFELPDGGAGNFRFVADAALTATSGTTGAVLDYYWSGGGQGGTTSLTRSVKGQTILGSGQTPGVKTLGVVDEIRKGTGSTIPVQTQGQLVIGLGLVKRQDGQPFVPGTLMAGARVDGPTAGDPDASMYGRFGIYLPAVPLRDLKDLAEMRILGLRQDSSVRSNLALINPGSESVTLRLELQVTRADGSAAGVLPTVSCGASQVQAGLVTLPARSFCQIGGVLGVVGATSGYAILNRAGTDAANQNKPYYAYGVVNDGPDNTRGTSDGAYLLAELVPVASVSLQFVDPPGTVNGALPAATVHAAYPKLEGTASPSGRTYTFGATGLPQGMSFGQGDNKWFLQGTPTQTGTFTIAVTVTDQTGASASKSYTLTVGACSVTLSPTSATVSQQGSTNPNAFDVTTGASCKWTAVPKDSWLHVTVTTLQTGSQKVLYTWDASTAATRTGKIDIVLEGQTAGAATFTVTQTGGCSFTFDPPLTQLCQAGGEKTVTVTPSGSSCTGPFATDAPTWITPPTTPMNGQAITVTYTVAAMSGSSLNTVREGTLYVQGQPGYQAVRQSSPQAPTAANTGPLCAGSALNLTATGEIANATYAWTGPNGFTSTLQNPSIAAPTTAASGTYSVTQTINGCVSPAATTTVTVNPNPEITSFTANPTSITKGQSSQLTAVFANGTGVLTNDHSSDAIPVTSGTPASVSPLVPTVYTLTVTSNQTPSCGTKTATASISVDCPNITISPASLTNGTAGVAYPAVALGSTGGVGSVSYAITVGALPSGMSLASGSLGGTPTATGTFNFTVTATDSNGCTGTKAYSLSIVCPAITVTPASLANGTAGVAYTSVPLGNTGGVGTATYAITAGALPAGMSLTSGSIGGTPIATGTFNFTVTATDSNGCTGTKAYSLSIVCPTITVTPGSLTSGTTGVAYPAVALGNTGGVGAVTYAITSGALPAGMSLTSGSIGGTPTATGVFDFTVTATDSNGCTGTKAYSLSIGSGGTLLFDDFSDGNADGWQTFVTGWQVNAGAYRITNTGANIRTESIWTAGSSWGNYTATVKVRPGNTYTPSGAFLHVRYAAENQRVDCQILNGSFGRTLALYVVTPGGNLPLQDKVVNWSDNTWYTLRGTASGSTFSCEILEIPGSLVSGSSIAAPSAGTIGVRNAHIIVDFDDVTVVSTP